MRASRKGSVGRGKEREIRKKKVESMEVEREEWCSEVGRRKGG